MPKVTVLTVTKRSGWAQTAVDSLLAQTFKDFNWVVVYELEGISSEDVHILQNSSIPTTLVQAPKKTKVSNLNASDNAGLRACDGEYVMFYQDLIILEDDCLEKFMKIAAPDLFLTSLTRNPEGDEEDPRYTWQDEVRDCQPPEWEENVALAPLKAFYELGGYDETYDDGWAWNNVNVAERAAMLGYKFKLDETNRPQLILHKKEPELHPDIPLNGAHHEQVMADIRSGKAPIKLSYLN